MWYWLELPKIRRVDVTEEVLSWRGLFWVRHEA